MTREFIRGKETQGQTQGRRPRDNKEIRMMYSQAKEHQRTPEAGREHVPVDTLIWASILQNGDHKYLLF